VSESKTLITAAWVAPITAPLIRDGGVVFAGERIVAVGPLAELKCAHPDAAVFDGGNAVLLPGLVNAHTHLELTLEKRPPGPIEFVAWVKRLLTQLSDYGTSPSPFVQGVVEGSEQCRRFGVTTIADIGSWARAVRRVLSHVVQLRVFSFGEVRAMGQRRTLLDERLAAALEAPSASSLWSVGISPHAPYSMEPDGYRRCLSAAIERGLPLTTHLAETRDETDFVANHTGPLRDLWNWLGGWDEQIPRFAGGPIRFAKSLGLLDYSLASLAHVNYCDDDELTLLAHGKATVVYCPRTHAYFRHPPHRWREMLARGINVAVGTDSCASSPDLNLVDDLRLLHRIAPDVSAQVLWEMATVRGARAFTTNGAVGSLEVGALADAALFRLRDDAVDPLLDVLESDVIPTRMWLAGK
jgi:cytosine/adenosine deaminase-related metal-dependent hydrolase